MQDVKEITHIFDGLVFLYPQGIEGLVRLSGADRWYIEQDTGLTIWGLSTRDVIDTIQRATTHKRLMIEADAAREELRKAQKEQRRATYVMRVITRDSIRGVLSKRKCRADCWEAKGLDCRCSCAGRNHAIVHDPSREIEYHNLLLGEAE